MFVSFFLELRAAKVPASLREFLTLLEAMRAGVVSFDIDEFNVHAPMPVNKSGLAIFKPAEPGSYTCYCSVPGHRERMHGTLIVEP